SVALFGERGAAETGESRIVGSGAIEHPAVESDFADGDGGSGSRAGFPRRLELGEQRATPIGRSVADVPRMKAETRNEPRRPVVRRNVAAAECGDVGPVGFARAVHDSGAERQAG